MRKKFPVFKQINSMDCGPTCLRMILKFYGANVSAQQLRMVSHTARNGTTLENLKSALDHFGIKSSAIYLNIETLREVNHPCILHWKQNHFIILFKIKGETFFVADPGIGTVKLTSQELVDNWYIKGKSGGYSLVINKIDILWNKIDIFSQSRKTKWRHVLKFYFRYKSLLIQIFISLLFGLLIQLTIPFLTQAIVDIGIKNRDINFVYIILISQIALFLIQTTVSFVRSWITLHLSTRVNISVLTELLNKLMRLPMHFFETKTHGDIMQRMYDQRRIEAFFTSSSLNTLLSFCSLIMFGTILYFYDVRVFLVFILANIMHTIWIFLFMKKRKILDAKRFKIESDNQNSTVEIIHSIQEIKQFGCSEKKQWGWEKIQAELFRYKEKSLGLSQYQQGGVLALNQVKNIIISFFCAKAVIEGTMTLGGMVAIQYIINMMNSSAEQLVSFIQSFQDAKISLERIHEIHEIKDEETENYLYTSIPEDKTIRFRNVTFTYFGSNKPVLENLDLEFPMGKTTAIVGSSGSGKTTILKLLMRFYEPLLGKVEVGNIPLEKIKLSSWRDACGIVTPNGYIYNDSIEDNITLYGEQIDQDKLLKSIKITNLNKYISDQPYGLKTTIGGSGQGISQGQKQRILIARVVYKNPDFIFLDEATNCLDAKNEKQIVDNLAEFSAGKTVIVVAHRLSTVKNADNIIVIEEGKVIEQGTHHQLISQEGAYYNLVSNQLELN